jgi:hypothetical protein
VGADATQGEALSSKHAAKDGIGQKPLNSWSLCQLIQVAAELKLIGRTADRAAWALKDFCNFIQPYNVLQQSARTDEPLALNGFTAVQEIVRSLKGRLAGDRH